MAFSEIAEIFICVLAVWGVYCIFRSFVLWCLPHKNISVALHTDATQSEYELYCSLRQAQLVCESKTEFSSTPVILIDGDAPDGELERLSDTGVPVYINVDSYRKRHT
jgi:hypothetical protein